VKTLALSLIVAVAGIRATEHYVSPAGKPENAGTKESPWDLATALSNAKAVEPGSTIWVEGGTYQGKFQVKLVGTEAAPVRVRVPRGERATVLNSGVEVVEPSAYVWLQDLEIMGDVPVERRLTDQTGSWPKGLPGTGGLEIRTGKGCKFIDLVIHDNLLGGVGWWIGSTDSEFHGCVIYNNGWKAPDRTHGHCIYTQNKDGTKTISNCIFTVPAWGGSYTLHAYGSKKAFVDNYVIEDNIAFERGPFLVGGGQPSHHIIVRRNYLHGVSMQIGYNAPENEDCEVRDNVIVGKLSINKYRKVVDEGNALDSPQARSIVIPDKYNQDRAHVAVFNASRSPEHRINVASLLKPGDSFRLMDPKNLFGKPILEGRCETEFISAPISGDFAAFVLLKGVK
jgi:hypothetical protein